VSVCERRAARRVARRVELVLISRVMKFVIKISPLGGVPEGLAWSVGREEPWGHDVYWSTPRATKKGTHKRGTSAPVQNHTHSTFGEPNRANRH
jgi:hypothetical protein